MAHSMLVDHKSAAPSRKVSAAGAGGGLGVVVVWVVGLFGVDVPAEVAAAIATLTSFVAGYVFRESV